MEHIYKKFACDELVGECEIKKKRDVRHSSLKGGFELLFISYAEYRTLFLFFFFTRVIDVCFPDVAYRTLGILFISCGRQLAGGRQT